MTITVRKTRTIVPLSSNGRHLPWYGPGYTARSSTPNNQSVRNIGRTNYENIISRNTRSNGAKFKNYTKRWLNISTPGILTKGALKKLTLLIHPNKTINKTNRDEIAKRTALIKLLLKIISDMKK
jgi:hypothetical protein